MAGLPRMTTQSNITGHRNLTSSDHPRISTNVATTQRVGLALAAVGALAIAAATLTPSSQPQEDLYACIWCGYQSLSDIVANIVLFAPMSLGLVLAGVRGYRVVMTAAGFSALVELAQLLVIPGRDASAGDVLMNTAAACLTVLAVAGWHRIAADPRARNRFQ